MKAAISNGKKWALISKKLQIPRSENSVKNRFNCLLRKERSQKTEYSNDYSRDEPEPE
jgi:myb-related protein